MTKRILVILILMAVMLTFTAEALRTGYCIVRDESSGYYTYSKAIAVVSVDYITDGYGEVTDNYVDGFYAAAHFIYKVNGETLYDLWFGVPDGGTVSVDFPSSSGDVSEVISEGYFGTLDSQADAIARWAPYCPS